MGSLKVVIGDEILVEKRNLDEKKQHRRSRSASDRNGELPGVGILSFVERKHNLPQDSPISTRTSHGQSIDSSTSSSNQRASLEKDIQLLQMRLQQEKSMRTMLEKAIGRTSSTLSPGHRHSASQTKELISEIELLEEEVANREQRVLTLYRSIFEKSVSRPPSEQSSGMTSPAHAKPKLRKHPSIITSAFCSSNNFPFRAFSLKSASDNRDSRIRTASPSTVKTGSIHYKKSSSAVIRVDGKSPFRDKPPGARTLKDHLHQCPSKLSEEMVRSMAAVYCWLCGIVSTKPEVKPPSKSCANLPPQSRNLENHISKSMVEISSMPTNKNQYSQASYAINNYRALVEQLEKVDVSQMEAKAQIAFWINVYNSLIMHAYLAYGIPHSSLRRVALFHKAAYNIGGLVISANAIEHSIFCFHTTRVGGWLETILSTAFRKKSAEEKQLISLKLGLPNSQSAVCFALCTGAFSDPVLKVYTAANVKEELEKAKREFLQTNIIVKKSKKVFLPKLLERVAREANMGSDSLLKWVCENVDKKLQNSIQRCLDGNNGKKASQIIEWLPHCSKFRYAFSQELATKPWWI
ncbi:uncharacterized protein LOC141592168 [Silene latifolia]|uniref:uncharacterized protein LOC141592168 n=1 Tax=Silene latifolia TaxID=37657 RepID=UPI003D787A4A